MKVSGTAVVRGTPEQVYAALNNPAVLVRTIPGCEQLEGLGGDRYRMTVTAGVASIKGSYLGVVELADPQPPTSFTLRASGAGAPGTVTADVKVRLDADPDGGTRVSYDADAVVGGPVGGVGQRVLAGVARKTAAEFFAAVEQELTGATARVSPVSDGNASDARPDVPIGQTVFTRTVTGGPDLRSQLPAAVVGAAIALVGVLVGFRLGRRRSPAHRSGATSCVR